MLSNKLLGATSPANTVSSLTFTAGGTRTTDGTTQNLSLAIGAANANRYIVVVLRYRLSVAGATAPATVTIGGQACSIVIEDAITSAIRFAVYITNAPLTSGTTATFTVTAPAGYTLTSSFMSAYSLITLGVTPKLIYSDANVTAENTVTVASPWVSGNHGIVAGRAATSNTLTGMSMSATGVATQNYSSAVIESGAIITAKLIGSGNVTFTTTGTAAVAKYIIAIWK